MNRRTSILAVVVALALAGCSSSSGTGSATGALTPVPSAAVQASPSATPTVPAGPATLALGKSGTTISGSGTAYVFAYRQPVAKGAPSPQGSGLEWGAVDVKVCIHDNNSYVSNDPWTLVYSDDGQVAPSNTGYNEFPTPGYPFGDKIMKAGRCIRGWIVFPVPKGKRPVMVEYTLDDGTVLDWKI